MKLDIKNKKGKSIPTREVKRTKTSSPRTKEHHLSSGVSIVGGNLLVKYCSKSGKCEVAKFSTNKLLDIARGALADVPIAHYTSIEKFDN